MTISATSKRDKRDSKKEYKKKSQTETRKCFTYSKVSYIQKDCSIWKREQKKNTGDSKNSTDSKASIAYDLE
jgi:hypothetical protein